MAHLSKVRESDTCTVIVTKFETQNYPEPRTLETLFTAGKKEGEFVVKVQIANPDSI